MLIPAGSESGHQGMSVFFSLYFSKVPKSEEEPRECASSFGERNDDSRALGRVCVCMCGKEKETNLIVSPLYLSQR